jgi:hypothetical protein
MNASHQHFLPDRLRPRATRRRSRRAWPALALAVAGLLLGFPLWTVRAVEVRGGDVVPPAVTTSIEAMVGHSVPILDLDWLRWVAETWPAAAEVRVGLELPGTLVVEVFPEPVRGSERLGRSWHGVAADGRLTGLVDGSRAPLLEGFRRPADRRQAFATARRLAEASGGTVTEVRRVTPFDFRVAVAFAARDEALVVHVTPGGSEAERVWCEMAAGDGDIAQWADLRWENRMVLGARTVHSSSGSVG